MFNDILSGLTAILVFVTAVLNLIPLLSSLRTQGSLRRGFSAFLMTFIASVAAFFLGALFEGSNALNDHYPVTRIVAREKIEQRKFLQAFKSSSDSILQIWNSMVNDEFMKDDKEILGAIRSNIVNTLNDAKMRDGGQSNESQLKGRVDLLSVRDQYRFIYYSTNLHVALAHTSIQDRKKHAEQAIERVRQLEDFLIKNKEKLGQGWLESEQIKLRNMQLKTTAVCLLASSEDKNEKERLNKQVSVLVNLMRDMSSEYVQKHGITATHPLIGQRL